MSPRISKIGPMLVLLALGGALAAWTWRTWPDVLIDFGREAYVAWRLGAGDTLYRDVAYLNGPLSPYWNALVMRTTDLGMSALFLGNAIVLALLVGLILHRLTNIAGRGVAFAVTAGFLMVFAFGRSSPLGNYSYLAPYSHEMTHGLLLAFAALACVARAQPCTDRGSLLRWSATAGLCLGAVMLMKLEIFVALLPAVVVGLMLSFGEVKRAPPRPRAGPPLVAVAAAAATVCVAWSGLTLATPLGVAEAGAGLFAGFTAVLDPRLTQLPFYRWGSGLDDVPGNALGLLNVAGFEIAALLPALYASLRLRGDRARVVAGVGAALTVAALLLFRSQIRWLELARPLPLFMLGLGMWRVAPLLRSQAKPAERAAAIGELPLILFAGALLAKLGLHARVFHYGFALAMPACLLAAVTLLAWIPAALDARGRTGFVFRTGAAAILLVVVVAHLERTADFLANRQAPLGAGVDLIRGDPLRADILAAALSEIDQVVAPGGTLLVLPEGIVLNYLARRRTPTKYIAYTPFDEIIWGEESMLAALLENPPDAVLLVHRNTVEYGAPFLGRDYGGPLANWVKSRYRIAQRWGEPPLRPGTRFGAELWLPR